MFLSTAGAVLSYTTKWQYGTRKTFSKTPQGHRLAARSVSFYSAAFVDLRKKGDTNKRMHSAKEEHQDEGSNEREETYR